VSSPQSATVPANFANSASISQVREGQQPGQALMAIGLLALGVLALRYGDFALVWQPVPEWLPARHAVAYASGVLMLLLGVGLLFRTTASLAARVLFPYLILWACLKLPAIFVAPQIEGVWLGLGELTLLLAGGWMLFCQLVEVAPNSKFRFLAGESGMRAARIMFGLSAIPVGLSHLVYGHLTADYVPAWLPYRIGWAYLTGAGQIAAGLGVLFSVLAWLAAAAEAGMITCFTLLVWLPAILRAPKERLNWTAFFISWIIGSAAWIVAQNITRQKRNAAREGTA
jgi:uncharacterized membrane protein